MADSRIIIDTRINTTQPTQATKSLKSQAASIAATYRKQGMSASEAWKKAWSEIERSGVKGSNKTKASILDIKNAFASLNSTVSRLGGLLTSVLGPISFIWLAKECTELGSSVREVQNVVDTAFGSMAYKMEEFADTAITNFGMSELAAKKTGSTLMAMAKGIGIADDAASDMAITLTGLTGDVASFYNISQDAAATKLKSVFTGETESLKELGVVMTQTNLEQYALSKGISKSISTMTQAELASLRYHFVLDSLSLASGDFVKTQDSWANQTRILSENLKTLGANIGQILTVVLLPAVKTLNEIVADLVHATGIISAAISSIFGVQISQNSQIASTATEAAKAENALAAGINAAAKAAKKSLAGFDELNILQRNTSGGVSGGSSDTSTSNNTSSTPGKDLDPAKVEKVAEIIKEIAEYVPIIAAGFAGFKLGSFIADLLTANATAETLKDTIKLIGKKGVITGGVTLAVAGIATYFIGIYDAITNGIDWLNATLIGAGATSAGAGIGALIGSAGGPIGTGIGALIGLAVGLITDALIWLWQEFDEIEAWFKGLPLLGKFVTIIAAIFTSCQAPILGIGAAIIFVVKKFDDIKAAAQNVALKIYEFFQPAAEWFGELFGSIYQTVSDVFYNIGVIARGCWEIIQYAWEPVSAFFGDLWDSISTKAREAWATIKEVFGPAAKWIKEHVIDPISKGFASLKDGFKGLINGLISLLNAGMEGIWGSINGVLTKMKNIKVGDIQPFADLKTISVPQIPHLARGAVLPPNKPFMAVVGDQTHGTNVEAPLSTIQEAVAIVMEDMIQSNIAGQEAIIAVLKEILEAVLGIEVGDDVIGRAVTRYNAKRAIMRGGYV